MAFLKIYTIFGICKYSATFFSFFAHCRFSRKLQCFTISTFQVYKYYFIDIHTPIRHAFLRCHKLAMNFQFFISKAMEWLCSFFPLRKWYCGCGICKNSVHRFWQHFGKLILHPQTILVVFKRGWKNSFLKF